MSDHVTVRTMEVRKDNWADTQVVSEAIEQEPGDGEVLLKVDRLALTANNISYASAGDALGYWKFFPASDGWGRIPAMGWGEVIASTHPGIETGERVWGWFPISTHLRIRAGNVSTRQFCDVSDHRDGLAPVYAQFDRASTNPIYDSSREDQDSLLRGLFMTSWLVEDFLHSNDAFAAARCLMTSASSKTAIALAHCIRVRGTPEAVGITSARNADFCKSLGYYDEVITYDELDSLDADSAVVLVDMAGSAPLLSDLHHHYGDNMKYSCRIGATHYDQLGSTEGMPGVRPEFFFAPAHVKKRSAELGPAELMKRMGTEFVKFRSLSDNWLRVADNRGEDAVVAAYEAVLSGQADPAVGQIVSMWP
ncbi:MAG: DUF2855 family protein [Gammaproteobacteria bacterium]|nr:DUF2855 family protein [Gammaproteobacteria bacterium]